VRALIVEERADLATILLRVLSEDGYTADLCANGARALALGSSGLYGLIIIDGTLSDIDGASVCRELRRKGVPVPILMLISRAGLGRRGLWLDSGINDFLVEPFDENELMVRARALVLRIADQGHLRIADLEMDRLRHRVLLRGKKVDLTTREYEFLMHLMHHVDQPLSRVELLAKIWDIGWDPSSNLVENMVSRLRAKLGRHAWMIETLPGLGYRLRSTRRS
jgi:DNA-binding response OmpR family regulator